ncbi:g2540 [Coccomyxa elongata]
MATAMDEGLEGPTGQTAALDEMMVGTSGDEDSLHLQRASATYYNKDERFRIEKRTYDNQYAQLYFCRLLKMAPRLKQRIGKQWPGMPVTKILDLPENQEVVVIGTLYKEMKLKPSILNEYNKERGIETLTGHTSFVSDDDSLVLEDESARMALRGIDAGPLVTGVVAAVRGVSAPNGEFRVKDMLFTGPQPQSPLPEATGGDKYVALVSGLSVGDEAGEPARVSLLVDYLAGLLGSPPEQEQVAKIVRTVIAGGLLHSMETLVQAAPQAKQRQQTAALVPIKDMDMCLTQLAGAMDVDVMAGGTDPANHALPQQPLHPCLLPGAVSFPTLHRVTNPHEFEVDGVTFLGTSGQNLDDIDRYSTETERLPILARLLEWGHLVPTAPDTLTAYSFPDRDPFVIDSAPHVLFAGNQPCFATRLVEGPEGQKTRVICIPKFSSSGVLVLVNLSTLKVQPITFDARMDI